MRVVFLGTPLFARTVLENILNSTHEIVGVVCQPDRPNKRGNKIEKCPVKELAKEKGLTLFQFENIRDNIETLKELDADIFVTAAYGQILSEEIINIPPYKTINAHGSLLPKYRGASPVQYALLKGDEETGITVMRTVFKMDAGDIISSRKIKIEREDNTETLMNKLALLAGELIVETLDSIENGTAIYTKQDEKNATYTKMLKKENSYLDFNKSARRCENKVRAYNPNPVARFKVNGSDYKVYKAVAENIYYDGEIGEIVDCSSKAGLKIKTAEGVLSILEIQAENSKRLNIKDFLNGCKLTKGMKVD